ncbi:MAG: hypothetical protein J7518_02920 [Nocardioidaceae bacterium]|nr:hypothetical protein [Nocardioidaceae bacterium]
MRRYWKHSCISLALAVLWTLLSPVASNAAISHKSPQMVDVDTPHYIGYDSTLRAYHFQVTGRWRAACSGGKYCWPPSISGASFDIGTNDAVRIKFNGAVVFKRFRIRAYDACDHKTYDNTTTRNSGSFFNAYAGVDDRAFVSWTSTTNTLTGSSISSGGSCWKSSLPSTTGAAGSYGYTNLTDLKAQHFSYDVWINPDPTQGSCYDHLRVSGGYTHTWSTQGLTWGVGYPWGVGLGVTFGSSLFTTWQDLDGVPDPSLLTGKVCRH